MDEDFRFVPKRPRMVQEEEEEEDHPSGLTKALRDALDAYRPIGGRVAGTDNLLLNWRGPSRSGAAGGSLRATGRERRTEGTFALDDGNVPNTLDGPDTVPDSAQNVIRRNIANFLQYQLNRYILNHREELYLDDRDVEQVQKNIITYWLNKHQRVERDPLFKFVELVAGMLDEKVEFLMADARNKSGVRSDVLMGPSTKGGAFSTGDAQERLLQRDRIVRETLQEYAEKHIEGKDATIDADTFMWMLQDFEISGHIEISPVVTNAWKAVHSEICEAFYEPDVGESQFYKNIKHSRVRDAYARATAAQMMLYRQLDKRRSYLAVDYERVKAHLDEAKRDVIRAIRNVLRFPILTPAKPSDPTIVELQTHAQAVKRFMMQNRLNPAAYVDADMERFLGIVSGVADLPMNGITTISGQPTQAVRGIVDSVFSQVRSRRGIVATIVPEVLYMDDRLRSAFAQLVGMTLQVREHSTSFKRGQRGHTDSQRAQVERDMNSVWTDMLMALKDARLLKIPPPPAPYRSF